MKILLLLSIPLALCQEAIEWESSGNWDGADGEWSSFAIRVGSIGQEAYARVMPATSWQETWVVLPQACPNSTNEFVNSKNDKVTVTSNEGTQELCSDDRGLVIDVNQTAGWFPRQLYRLDLNRDLGYTGNGQYGQVTVGLGLQNTGITLDKQVVAGIIAKDWWVGIFGLSSQPTNFTDYNNPESSFLQSLFDQKKIPSLSWGYHIGAKYRLRGVTGQIVFGGYDNSRFEPNDVTLTLVKDSVHSFVLRDVSYTSNTKTTSTSLIIDADIGKVGRLDSATPYLFLPNETCTLFETAFGITYDENSKTYPITDAQHQALKEMNPTIRFSIADNTTSEIVSIDVPYDAFNLVGGEGFTRTNSTQRYFPLKKETPDTGVVLGRSFLQETYLQTDYGRGTYKVSKAVFKDNYEKDIVALPATDPLPKKTNVAAIAGGVAGGAVALIAIVVGLILWRRKRASREEIPQPNVAELPNGGIDPERHEIDGQGIAGLRVAEKAPVEIDGSTPATTPMSPNTPGVYTGHEQFRNVAELYAGPVAMAELPGCEVEFTEDNRKKAVETEEVRRSVTETQVIDR